MLAASIRTKRNMAVIVATISAASRSLSASMIIVSDLRGDIDQIRSTYFNLLFVCTLIVVAGVAIEGVHHFMSEGKAYVDEESGIFHAAPRTGLHKKLERLGWLLVILGVLGEGVFEGLTSSEDSVLQEFNATILSMTTGQARNAAESAKTAHNEADAAKESASTASSLATEAGRKVEEVKRETNKLTARLREEEDNLLQLEKDAAPRFIWQTITAKGTNIDLLRKFAGTTVIVESIPDWEARRAAGSIAAMLSIDGWNARKPVTVEKDLPEGVTVEKYRPPPTAQPLENWWGHMKTTDAASELMNWLEANDWQVLPDWADVGELQPGEILVLVGIKPVSFFQPWPLEHPRRNGTNKRADEIRKEIRLLEVPSLPHPLR
jgi:hypothetical protein